MHDIPGYTILRTLGQGGMALVYLAVQQSLGREVALKVLAPALAEDPVARERFLREARIAAQLHHPNIVAIHDVGEHGGTAYMAIAYEPGGSVAGLARPLDVDRALAIVRDVAHALDHAHEHGVVHRDIKPENVLVRKNGSYVLADFGIAQAAGIQKPLTREGTSVGTPHYMSPEQLRGARVDGRADLYALGVVLFQLVSGELPFRGEDSWAIGTQHLAEPVPRLPASAARVQSLVDALMAKEPDARPQTGADVVRRIDALRTAPTLAATSAQPLQSPTKRLTWRVIAALLVAAAGIALWVRWPERSQPPPEPEPRAMAPSSVAVLPFADLSEGGTQRHFADGMTEELITRLADVEELDVVSRTASNAVQGSRDDLATVGRKLNAALLVEGSVRAAGGRVRVAARIVDATAGYNRWSQTYDRELTDIFSIQDDIARAVVDAMRSQVLATASPPKPTTTAPAISPAPAPPPAPSAEPPAPSAEPPAPTAEPPGPIAMPAIGGDFKRAYAKGLDAVRDGNWTDAESLMAQAYAAEPAAYARMKLYGLRFEPYVPRLYLGIAAYRRGDCAAALPHLEDATMRNAARAQSPLSVLVSVADEAVGACKAKQR